MKIKGFIITGVLVLAAGAGITGYAATRDDFNFEEIKDNSVEFEEISYTVDEVNSIYLDAAADNYKIISNDSNEIKILGKKTKHMRYTYTLDETKKLTILQEYDKKWYFHIFPFNLFGFWSDYNTPYTISLPENAIEALDLEVNAGNVVIENQTLKNLILDINAGNVEINNLNTETLDIEVNAGNIKALNLTTNTVLVEVNAGNANMQGKIIKGGSFNVNAGNIDLELIGKPEDYCVNGTGTGESRITSEVDAGNFEYRIKE